MTEQTRDVERWTYAGRVRNTEKGLAHAWILPDGAEALYGVKASVIGGIYEIDVAARDEAGRARSIHKNVTWTGEHTDDEDKVLEWTARTRTAETHTQRARNEAKAAKVDALDTAMTPLLELAAKNRTRAERTAFIAQVLDRLTYAPGGRL